MIKSLCKLVISIFLVFGSKFAMAEVFLIQPDISYVCLMRSSDAHEINSMLKTFAQAHGMSFRLAPLDPNDIDVAIQLDGIDATVFATSFSDAKEFYIDIKRNGDPERYRSSAATLNRDVLDELAKIDSVVVKWTRLPANYEPTVPAGTRTIRGPDL